MVDFTAALGKKVTEAEKPKPKPAGTYRSVVAGLPKQKEVTVQGETKGVLSFSLRPIMAVQVDDQEALAAQPEVQSWPPQTREFWVMNGEVEDERGMYALRMFLTETLGIEEGPKGKEKTIGEMCAESPNRQCLTEYENYPYQNRDGQMEIGTRIKSTAAI